MAAEVKSFDSPDETREFEGKGSAKVVELAGHPVGYGTFEPGWKWATWHESVPAIGYVLSGSMRIYMDDGQEMEINPGDVFAIPPGHDAEVPGSEPCVMVDFGEIGDYAKR